MPGWNSQAARHLRLTMRRFSGSRHNLLVLLSDGSSFSVEVLTALFEIVSSDKTQVDLWARFGQSPNVYDIWRICSVWKVSYIKQLAQMNGGISNYISWA